jgi:hypothetical protein
VSAAASCSRDHSSTTIAFNELLVPIVAVSVVPVARPDGQYAVATDAVGPLPALCPAWTRHVNPPPLTELNACAAPPADATFTTIVSPASTACVVVTLIAALFVVLPAEPRLRTYAGIAPIVGAAAVTSACNTASAATARAVSAVTSARRPATSTAVT